MGRALCAGSGLLSSSSSNCSLWRGIVSDIQREVSSGLVCIVELAARLMHGLPVSVEVEGETISSLNLLAVESAVRLNLSAFSSAQTQPRSQHCKSRLHIDFSGVLKAYGINTYLQSRLVESEVVRSRRRPLSAVA